jgi:ABC-type transporter MlaC component
LRRAAPFIGLFLALTAAALAAVSPESYVAQTEVRFTAIRAAAADAKEPLCRRLVSDLFDESAVAAGAAGPLWKSFSASQRSALQEAVRRRIAGECAGMARRAETGEGVIRRVREIEGGIRLTVQYPDPSGAGPVFVWTLRPGGSFGWSARDLAIDGRGVVATLRADFEALLATHSGNVAAAIAGLGRTRPS